MYPTRLMGRHLVIKSIGSTVFILLFGGVFSANAAVTSKFDQIACTVFKKCPKPNQPSSKVQKEQFSYQDIYSANKDELRKLDERVSSISASQERSFDLLAHALTDGLHGDLEKVYVIHRWITSNIAYDTDAFFSNSQSALRQSANPNNVLKTRKAICDGYSQLMVELGKRAGLSITKVVGYAKGYGYSPGVPIKGSNHAWNIVRIEGKPYLLDSTWDAGGVNPTTRIFTRNTGPYAFFLASPDLFIARHYPNNPSNQLLNSQWSRAEFSEGYKSIATGVRPADGSALPAIYEPEIPVPPDVMEQGQDAIDAYRLRWSEKLKGNR